MMGDIYLCYCKDCQEFFIGREFRHMMYYCPTCKKNAVDIEEGYSRLIGNCYIIKKVKLTNKDLEGMKKWEKTLKK